MKELIINQEIRLKELGSEDVEAMFSIINSEREYMQEWLPFVDVTHQISDTEAFVDEYVNSGGKDPVFTIYFGNKLVGLIGFKDTDYDNRKTEIGYWLSEKYQHKGIVTRAARAMIDYAFDQLKLNRIQLKAATGNFKSQRVAERLGFTLEGTEREGELHQRGFVDLFVFGLLKADRDRTDDV